jgi:hypothetical protein
MTTDRANRRPEWDREIRDLADDIEDCVSWVVDFIVGHGATAVARALRHVDRLVDDVLADAAAVAHEAEDFFNATFGPCSQSASGDEADHESTML